MNAKLVKFGFQNVTNNFLEVFLNEGGKIQFFSQKGCGTVKKLAWQDDFNSTPSKLASLLLWINSREHDWQLTHNIVGIVLTFFTSKSVAD